MITSSTNATDRPADRKEWPAPGAERTATSGVPEPSMSIGGGDYIDWYNVRSKNLRTASLPARSSRHGERAAFQHFAPDSSPDFAGFGDDGGFIQRQHFPVAHDELTVDHAG